MINISTEIENQYIIKNGKKQIKLMKSIEDDQLIDIIGDVENLTNSEETEIEGNQVDFIIDTNSEKNI